MIKKAFQWRNSNSVLVVVWVQVLALRPSLGSGLVVGVSAADADARELRCRTSLSSQTKFADLFAMTFYVVVLKRFINLMLIISLSDVEVLSLASNIATRLHETSTTVSTRRKQR